MGKRESSHFCPYRRMVCKSNGRSGASVRCGARLRAEELAIWGTAPSPFYVPRYPRDVHKGSPARSPVRALCGAAGPGVCPFRVTACLLKPKGSLLQPRLLPNERHRLEAQWLSGDHLED